MWEIPKPTGKKFKFFISGPPGCFKTRLALRLANNGNMQDPATAVVDTEFGTDHYIEQFAFMRERETDPTGILKSVKQLVKKPGNIKTLIIDSFSVYYDILTHMWVDRFILREKTSAGNKGEYYTLQPRDYVHINRDAGELVRTLLKCDLNIFCICQVKDEWGENMKVVGSIFDGWKRLPYYFDTVINIDETPKKDGFTARIKGKDRSNTFKIDEMLPWANDEEIATFMTERIGYRLADGPAANSFDPDAVVPTVVGTTDNTNATSTAPVKETPAVTTEPKTTTQPASDTTTVNSTEPNNGNKPPPADEKKTAPDTSEAEQDDSGPVDKPMLLDIVKQKKIAKINDPAVWAKLLAKYGVETAKDMTKMQATELIKDLIRGEIPT